MKKTIIIALLALLCVGASAQSSIPSKLLKGIETTKDEFTGETRYSSKNCSLSIVQKNDSTTLYFSLSCASFDTPVKLKKIYVLTNGQTNTFDGNFSLKEIPTRFMTANATGRFGTSSYKGAQFGTRMNYVEEWKENAEPYLPMIKSIISNSGKVKFEGENNTLIYEFPPKVMKKMGAVLALYEYLKGVGK